MEIPQSLIDKGITQEQLDAFLYFQDKWFWEDFWDMVQYSIIGSMTVALIVVIYHIGKRAFK